MSHKGDLRSQATDALEQVRQCMVREDWRTAAAYAQVLALYLRELNEGRDRLRGVRTQAWYLYCAREKRRQDSCKTPH